MVNITHDKVEAQSTTSAGNSRATIRGFDFLVNAVWPEVVHLLETRLTSIFAPGNPDAFYKVRCVVLFLLVLTYYCS